MWRQLWTDLVFLWQVLRTARCPVCRADADDWMRTLGYPHCLACTLAEALAARQEELLKRDRTRIDPRHRRGTRWM